MKCFIASAFDREDVDAVYDNCVYPALERLSVAPLRVNRVEHNDDIDDKIFELLNKADFAIVDLTYARPSVYYEAGYAYGSGKPVIYIARNDHIHERADDPDGLTRVHFDLKMKNIITWTDANDSFSKRLDKRLRYVLKPLLLQREGEDRLKGERSRFDRLPQNSKIELLRKKAIAMLRVRSFRVQIPDDGRWLNAFIAPGVIFNRVVGQQQQKVIVIFTASAEKRIFARIQSAALMGVDLFQKKHMVQSHHYVIVSLKSVPQTRVTNSLSEFHPLNAVTFHHVYESNYHPNLGVFVHVIGGVKSEEEFSETFRTVIKQTA